jgi:hypothetical protein
MVGLAALDPPYGRQSSVLAVPHAHNSLRDPSRPQWSIENHPRPFALFVSFAVKKTFVVRQTAAACCC